MTLPGFENGKKCFRPGCGHYHFHPNFCNQCDCKSFFPDPRKIPRRGMKPEEFKALPPAPVFSEATVQRCQKPGCGAPIVWGIHDNRKEPLDYPPQRRLVTVARRGAQFVVKMVECYTSHWTTCNEKSEHIGRAERVRGGGEDD